MLVPSFRLKNAPTRRVVAAQAVVAALDTIALASHPVLPNIRCATVRSKDLTRGIRQVISRGGTWGPYTVAKERNGRIAIEKREAQRCDQCEAAMINGVYCHETGCPNTHARYDKERQEWVKTYKCRECGDRIDKGEECNCTKPVEDDEFHPATFGEQRNAQLQPGAKFKTLVDTSDIEGRPVQKGSELTVQQEMGEQMTMATEGGSLYTFPVSQVKFQMVEMENPVNATTEAPQQLPDTLTPQEAGTTRVAGSKKNSRSDIKAPVGKLLKWEGFQDKDVARAIKGKRQSQFSREAVPEPTALISDTDSTARPPSASCKKQAQAVNVLPKVGETWTVMKAGTPVLTGPVTKVLDRGNGQFLIKVEKGQKYEYARPDELVRPEDAKERPMNLDFHNEPCEYYSTYTGRRKAGRQAQGGPWNHKNLVEVRLVQEGSGSIILFEPLTENAKSWLKENVGQDAQWLGQNLAVEPRYADDLIQGLSEAGLVVAGQDADLPDGYEWADATGQRNAQAPLAVQAPATVSQPIYPAYGDPQENLNSDNTRPQNLPETVGIDDRSQGRSVDTSPKPRGVDQSGPAGLGDQWYASAGTRTAASHGQVIQMFLNDEFPKDKKPVWPGGGKLRIKKQRGGWALVNYSTPLCFRPDEADAPVFFNVEKYSVTTSKIQSLIQRYGSGLVHVDERALRDEIARAAQSKTEDQ